MSVADKHGDARSEKGRRTRAKFLEAGKAVFARDGFLKARIADIAAEAGVSYGAFYHYFDSKEVLFREIVEEMEFGLLGLDDLREAGGRPDDPYERIRAANRSYLAAYGRNSDLMRVIEEVSWYDSEVRAVRSRRQEKFAARLGASIVRLQQEGRADPEVDVVYAATALGGMVATFASALFADSAPFDFDRAVEQLSILWANAIGIQRGSSVKLSYVSARPKTIDFAGERRPLPPSSWTSGAGIVRKNELDLP